MARIPILTNDSFRILGLKQSDPKLNVYQISAKTKIPAGEVQEHIDALYRANLFKR